MVTQLHYARNSEDAIRMTNNIVTLYKGFGWVILDVDMQEDEYCIQIKTMRNNGDIKRDKVTW